MTQSPGLSRIDVCICTFKRPDLLARLLQTLGTQQTGGLFEHAVVVIDNDRNESAKATVEAFAEQGLLRVRYRMEPQQNIAMARNAALAEADGDLVALIDDDEFPEPTWLLNLYRTMIAHQADGVLAPVKPFFEAPPPTWVVDGRFCERPSYATGTVLLDPRQTRTGNALIRRSLFTDEVVAFDPRYGRTGGEDVDFFRRKLAKGHVFVWCDEAPAFESVPAQRLTRKYFLRRALLRGVANAERVSFLSAAMLKSLLAAGVYTLMLPPLLLWRHAVFMQYLMRNCDHLGKIFAVCGIRLVRERDGS